jgi:hypothetical protein
MPVVKIGFKEDDNVVLAQHPLDTISTTMKTANSEPVVEIDSGDGCIERFIAKAKQFRNYPPAQFYYHAFGNVRDNWTPEKAKIIIDHARKYGLEVRAWGNEESAINLLVVKDPDTSEDSGMELYEKMEGKHDSYGLASWYEFESWGVPVYTGEDVVIDWLKDHFGIKIGDAKVNEWVALE